MSKFQAGQKTMSRNDQYTALDQPQADDGYQPVPSQDHKAWPTRDQMTYRLQMLLHNIKLTG